MKIDGEIALFGGSFNPPHMGHVYVIAQVLARTPAARVMMVPTHTHAFGKELLDFEARLRLCEGVAEIFPGRVLVSDVEGVLAAAGRENRTVDTLEHLRAVHPQARLSLVIGSDLISELPSWKGAERIDALAERVVINREGYPTEGMGPSIPDVSSTWVRERMAEGASVSAWVPRRVIELCEAEGWYLPPR